MPSSSPLIYLLSLPAALPICGTTWTYRHAFRVNDIFLGKTLALKPVSATEVYTIYHLTVPYSGGIEELLWRVWNGSAWSASAGLDRKSTRLNSSHTVISYAVLLPSHLPPFPTRRSSDLRDDLDLPARLPRQRHFPWQDPRAEARQCDGGVHDLPPDRAV